MRFELCPKSKHGKSKISTPHTLCSTKTINSETGSTLSSYSSSSLKIGLTLFPPFPNENIALRHKTQLLLKLACEHCTHFLNRYLSWSPFRPLLLTPSSQSCASWGGLDNYSLSFDLGEWTVEYISQDPPSQNKVTFSWCQICDIRSSLHSCTEVYLQSSNNKILSLAWC